MIKIAQIPLSALKGRIYTPDEVYGFLVNNPKYLEHTYCVSENKIIKRISL
jgi:hypothetical protein